MIGILPPGTYQQWLDFLDLVEKTRNTDVYIRMIQAGTLQCSEHMLFQLEQRVTHTVNMKLRRMIRWYTKRINSLLEDADYSDLVVLFYRLRRDVVSLRFYQYMTFLPAEYVEELDRQVVAEIRRYWEHLLSSLQEAVEETHNILLEDELHRITRIRF